MDRHRNPGAPTPTNGFGCNSAGLLPDLRRLVACLPSKKGGRDSVCERPDGDGPLSRGAQVSSHWWNPPATTLLKPRPRPRGCPRPARDQAAARRAASCWRLVARAAGGCARVGVPHVRPARPVLRTWDRERPKRVTEVVKAERALASRTSVRRGSGGGVRSRQGTGRRRRRRQSRRGRVKRSRWSTCASATSSTIGTVRPFKLRLSGESCAREREDHELENCKRTKLQAHCKRWASAKVRSRSPSRPTDIRIWLEYCVCPDPRGMGGPDRSGS